VREFHAGAQRHVFEVRYVRFDDGVFLKAAAVSETAAAMVCS